MEFTWIHSQCVVILSGILLPTCSLFSYFSFPSIFLPWILSFVPTCFFLFLTFILGSLFIVLAFQTHMHLVVPFCDCLVLDVEIGEHGFHVMSQRTSSCCCCCCCCCRLVIVMVWWWFGYGESWRMMAFLWGFLLLIMNVWAHEICRFAFASLKIVMVGVSCACRIALKEQVSRG